MMDTIRSFVAKFSQAPFANPHHAFRVCFIGCVCESRFTLGLQLVSALCQCSCWCDCEGTARRLGLLLRCRSRHWDCSGALVWRFFRPAGPRGLTDFSFARRAFRPARPVRFGLRCRRRSTMCPARNHRCLVGASRRGHRSGRQAVFSSPGRKAYSQALPSRLLTVQEHARLLGLLRAGCSLHAVQLRPASSGEFTHGSAGLFWWHDHSNGSSRSAATAAATSNAFGPCRRLCSGDADFYRGQTGHRAGGTGG